jgi:hypothetical protein
MTEGALTRVRLDEIDTPGDDPCAFHFYPMGASLRESVRAFGVLSPPRLRKAGGRLAAVCGFRRLEALRQAGGEKVDAFVLGAVETERALRLSLEDNLHPPRLEEEDRIQVLESFRRFAGYDVEKLASSIAPRLGLPKGFGAVQRRLAAAEILPQVRTDLLKGTLKIRHVLECATDPPPLRDLLLNLWRRLGPTSSTARLLRERVLDLWVRRGETPEVIEEISRAQTRGSGREARALLETIDEMRYPALRASQRRFERAREALCLPPAVSVSHAPFFEGDEVTFAFSCRTKESFADAAGALGRVAGTDVLGELLAAGRGHADDGSSGRQEDSRNGGGS